jgi:GT2 family glycosyltransferase
MDLSIIIVSFNTKKLLDDCLASINRSLRKSTLTTEIIVVDNISTDGTREMLTNKYKGVRTIMNDRNFGFGKANNQGIATASGAYILLLNSDTVVHADAIWKLYRFAQTKPRAFVGAKLLNTDGSDQTSCGPFLTLPVVFAALFLKGDRLGVTRWSPRNVRRVDWVSGACIMAPKSVFLDGLLFDEGIFMYMEEIDLLYRAIEKGYSTYIYPDARITHVGSGSSKDKQKGPVLNIYRGLTFFYRKHYGRGALFVLTILLKTKAALAWCIGVLTNNEYLKSTYGEAFAMV